MRGIRRGQKKPGQTQEKIQVQKDHSKSSENENKNEGCQTLQCQRGGGKTCDRQKWNEELERHAREKYQYEEMRVQGCERT